MSYTVQHFQQLRNEYPTWESLSSHLEKDCGIRVVQTEESGKVILRTKKSESSDDFLRSVVWDTLQNRPLCVAPFAGKKTPLPLNVEFPSIEECVDGVMINAFVEASGGSLKLATRTQIGAKNKFYSEKSFETMFQEALVGTSLIGMGGLEKVLRDWIASVEGATSCFVSFVLQHPEHRIVAKPTSAKLFCVHVGYCKEDGEVQMYETPVHWPEVLATTFAVTRYGEAEGVPSVFASEDAVKETLKKLSLKKGWRWQGLMVKDGAGARWALRSSTYVQMRKLRGGEATNLERFLRLRKDGLLRDYLKHYSEDKDVFWELEQKLRARTENIMEAYTDVHKLHKCKFKEIPEVYRPVVFRLHAKYMEQKKDQGEGQGKRSVSFKDVVQVVSELADFERKRLVLAAPYVSPPASVEIPEAKEAKEAKDAVQ